MPQLPALDVVPSLQALIRNFDDNALEIGDKEMQTGELFCNTCSRRSRIHVYEVCGYFGDEIARARASLLRFGGYRPTLPPTDDAQPSTSQKVPSSIPSLSRARCSQCLTEYLIVLYESAVGPALVILSNVSGKATPHTPEQVAYYIDQAQKSHIAGANSAAVAMYRAALEHLLEQNGYDKAKGNNLASRIDQLIVDLAAGVPDSNWAKSIDSEYMHYFRELGNTAPHTNKRDITKQHTLDTDLVRVIEVVFIETLIEVYEKPLQAAERKARLSAALPPKS